VARTGLALALALGAALAAAPARAETPVPSVLELVPLPPPDAEGRLAVELVLNPLQATAAVVTIVSPPGLRFASGERALRRTLVPGEPAQRERLLLPLVGAGDPALVLRIDLVEDDGRPWQTLERSLHLR
jgi:hypothetical protein